MRTRVRLATLGALLLLPVVAWAQYPSAVVGFNGGTIDDPSAQEMFRIPEWSGSTVSFVTPNDTGQFNYNYAARFSGLQTEGAAAEQVMWYWADPNDPDGWVRLTTFAGPEIPNPSLNTEGKVRFKFTNRSQLFFGAVGICLAIRETGNNVPQLADGGTSGEVEWVGVDTSTLTLIKSGPNGTIESTLGGDDLIVDVGGTEAISWGANRVFESTWNSGSDDVRVYGVYANVNGGLTPIPQLIINPSAGAYSLEWDLTTGIVSQDGTPQGGGIAPFTGDGDLNAPNNRGTLESICFTNYVPNTADQIIVAVDELQFESPVPDPVLPPTVVWPIIADDEHVFVSDIQFGATRVDLYQNGSPILFQNISTTDDVDFTLPSPAVTGDIYTATQTVGGVPSDQSQGVEVLPGPPPYTFSLLVDEGGTGSCNYTTGWEWVGASAMPAAWAPTGQPVFPSDGVWQDIDIPLTNDDLVIASLGGNGILAESPTGFYTIDSVWFTLADPAAADPNAPIYWELFIDSVQVMDEFGQPGEVVLTLDDGVAHFDGNRGQSPDVSSSSAPSTVTAYDGLTSHRIYWAYNGVAPDSVGVLQRISGCGTSALIPDTSSAIRFHMLVRGQPTAPGVAMPVVVGPIVGNQSTVRIQNDVTATSLQLYVNGVASGAPITPTGTPTDITGLTLVAGDSISATQDLPGPVTSDLAYPKVVQAKPLPPIVVTPVIPGGTTVNVSGLWTAPFATASLVTVLVNDVPHGTAVPSGSSVAVTLDVTLATGNVIKATQTVNGTTSDPSAGVEVALTAPVIFKAPAEGDTLVTVQNINAAADSVTIVLDGTTPFSATPTPGSTRWDVPVSGLVAGHSITAKYSVGSAESVDSAAEIITDNTITVRFSDNMESYVDQADFENASGEVRNVGWWPSSGDPGLNLVTDRNATVGGSKSAYAPAGMSPPAVNWQDGWQSNFDFAYPEPDFPDMAGTDQSPLVWSVNIYDAGGAGTNNLYQWAELRDYTSGGLGAIIAVGMPGTSFFPTINNNYYAARVYVNPGYINLNDPGAPTRSIGWHTFTTVIKNATIDFYIDGVLARKNVSRATKLFDNLYMSSGYAPGMEGWYDDYRLHNGKVTFQPRLPNAPKVNSPVVEGDTLVAVSSIEPDATLVTVSANGSPIGSIDPAGAASIDVPVTALVHLDSITASQTTAAGASGASAALEVGKGNGDILICLGIRETADTGPIGSQGSNSGDIEFLGASVKVGAAPQGKPLSPSASWQTITFDPATDGVVAFTGDGILSSANGMGVIENLAVAVDPNSPDRSTGPYELYVDNVVNVGADPNTAGDVVIADFEGYPLDAEALFQEPTFSGSTSANLSYPPSASVTTDAEGNPGQSEFLTWFWKDTTAERWARITTDGVATKPRPIIDLTKPIRMDVLLVAAGPAVCRGDTNCDGQIDFGDINPFVDALLNANYCDGTGANADVSGNGSVGFDDINPFVELLTTNPLPIACP